MGGGSVIGHQTLIAARMAGYRPTDVWLTSVEVEPAYGRFTHPEAQLGQMSNGRWVGFPDIHVLASESAAALDLRAVVGLVVHVLADSRDRAEQLLSRAAEFSPVKVIASGCWGMLLWEPGRGIQEFLP